MPEGPWVSESRFNFLNYTHPCSSIWLHIKSLKNRFYSSSSDYFWILFRNKCRTVQISMIVKGGCLIHSPKCGMTVKSRAPTKRISNIGNNIKWWSEISPITRNPSFSTTLMGDPSKHTLAALWGFTEMCGSGLSFLKLKALQVIISTFLKCFYDKAAFVFYKYWYFCRNMKY